MALLRHLSALVLAALVVAAAGCGDDNDSADNAGDTLTQAQTETQTQTQTTPETDTSTTVKAEQVTPSSGEADIGTKPKVPKGKGSQPSRLEAQDLIVGKGKQAKTGDTVSVQYVGVLFKNGKEFDASWQGRKPGQPFQFTLGGGQVIPGWDRGVAGMRKGGRRKLVIPPDLAYGAQGSQPDIPPNAALIFDIDLK